MTYLCALDVLEELELVLGFPFALPHLLKVEDSVSEGRDRSEVMTEQHRYSRYRR